MEEIRCLALSIKILLIHYTNSHDIFSDTFLCDYFDIGGNFFLQAFNDLCRKADFLSILLLVNRLL